VKWLADDEFRKNLANLLKEKSGPAVVQDLREIGITIDASLLFKIKEGEQPSSTFIGPMALLYGWAVPPLADADDELGTDVASWFEIRGLDPQRAARIRALVRAELEAARAAAKLKPR
jgi:hypothetical protein